MRTLPKDLMVLIQHIHSQYEKVLYSKTFSNKMCDCRKNIFREYTYTVEKLIIKLGSRTFKFLEDWNMDISCDVSGMEQWFSREIYENLYNDPSTSNKMVLTIQILQEDQDKKFFRIIEEKYKLMLSKLKMTNGEGDVDLELSKLLEEIRAWYELFVYIMLSTQFNCQSISNDFLTDYGIDNDEKKKACNGDCDGCVHNNDDEECEVHKFVEENGESVKIIMNNEFISDMNWLTKIRNFVQKYHHDPSKIKFVFDYRMFDQHLQYRLGSAHLDEILDTEKVFVDTEIKNYEGIDFNGYYEKIVHLLK